MGFMAYIQQALVAEVINPTHGGLPHKEKER